MNSSNILNSGCERDSESVILVPANKSFTKLNGFATFFGIEYVFAIDNIICYLFMFI